MKRLFVILLLALAARADGGALIDVIDLGAAPDERIRSDGDVMRDVVGDLIGGHDMRRPARIVRGEGSWIEFELRVEPDKPTTLEFEEMYGRDQLVRAYHVLVDGKPVHFRTWQGCGGGAVHYFVQLPPAQSDMIRIRLLNRADAPFAVARVWCFSDFDAYFTAGGFDVPYHIAPTVPLGHDFDHDLARISQIRRTLGEHPHVKPAWTTWIAYANLADADLQRRIDYALRLTDAAQMPVQLSFDTWWANTPSGADGRGGYWYDVQYQQVVYNATQRRMQLSIPNQWSSTPWLSVNHPDLLDYKTRRLKRAMQMLRTRHAQFIAGGRPDPLLAINLDNEPVYWASGNAGLGGDLLQADFNAHAVAAARADGITLDPADGLDPDERHWLHRNLTRYNERIGAAAAEPLHGELRRNIYTQGFAANNVLQYPMLDPAWGLWETAAASSVRLGAEWNGDSLREREAMARMVPLGRIATVNVECGNDAANNHSIDTAYAMGHRYWAPYNYPLDAMHIATEPLGDVSQQQPPFLYQPVLFEQRFGEAGWMEQLYDHSGITTELIGNTTAVAARPSSNEAAGHLTWRLVAPNGRFDGLQLELSGRAFVHRATDPRVNIRVLAGTAPQVESMQQIGVIHDSGDINYVHRFPLDALARGREVLFVRLELSAPDLPPSLLSWCAVHHVRFTMPWPAEMTERLPPQDYSLATLRRQNLVVGWRREAELAIADNPLPAAKKAYQQGRYRDAYRIVVDSERPEPPADSDEIERHAGREIQGVVRSTNAQRQILTVIPDEASGSCELAIDSTTAITRTSDTADPAPAELSDLRRGDRVQARIDARGIASHIAVSYQSVSGTIEQYQPLEPQQDCSITLAGHAREHVIDLYAPLHLPGGTTTVRNEPVGSPLLSPGERVRLRVDPATGRVFELWKVESKRR